MIIQKVFSFARLSLPVLAFSLFVAACSSSTENQGAADFNPADDAKADHAVNDIGTQDMKPLAEGFQRLQKWKDLVFVGVRAPSFNAFSEKSRQYLTQNSPPGKFFVYFHHTDLPSVCLDKDCGDIAAAVTKKGGHFMGFSDPKAVESLGILRHGKNGFEVYPSLVVVADKTAMVKAIFVHAELKDLPRILKESGY